MLKTAANPGGTPIEAFDAIRTGLAADRSQFYKDLTLPFFGGNRPNSKLSEGLRNQFWLQSMQVGLKPALDCIKAFSETDFTEDLKKIECPVFIMHGDDDQIVPIADAALLSVKLLKKGTLKVYEGLGHGMCTINADVVNAELLAFVQS